MRLFIHYFFLFLISLSVQTAFCQPPQSWSNLDSLRKVYLKSGDKELAEEYAQKARKVYFNQFGVKDTIYAYLTKKIGNFYTKNEQFKEALPYYEEAFEVVETQLGEKHVKYVSYASELAVALDNVGESQAAMRLKEDILILARIVMDKNLQGYKTALNNLASSYYKFGKYDQAMSLMLELMEFIKEEDPDYSIMLNNVAYLYNVMGRYEMALRYTKTALKLLEKKGFTGSLKHADALSQMSHVYEKMQAIDKSLPLLHQSLKIRIDSLGEWNSEVAQDYRSLSRLYRSIGLDDKSVYYAEKSVNILEGILEQSHPVFVGALHNLGQCHVEARHFKQGKVLLDSTLILLEQVYGKEHPAYANCLNSIAVLHRKMKNYKESFSALEESLEITKNIYGDTSYAYGLKLLNIASMFHLMGQLDSATFLFKQGLSLLESTVGRGHQNYIQYTHNFADHYTEMGNFAEAKKLYLLSFEGLLLEIDLNFDILSEDERAAFLAGNKARIENLLSFVYKSYLKMPQNGTLAYNYTLTWKDLLLSSSMALKKEIQSTNDSSLRQLYQGLIDSKNRLSYQFSLPKDQQSINTDSLRMMIAQLEEELARRSAIFGLNQQNVFWQEVQKKLKDKEAAIEFIHFRYEYALTKDSIIYAALVLRPNDKYPKLIPLFEEKQLDTLLSKEVFPAHRFVDTLYSKELYDLIWEPLDSLLKGAKTIYYAPSGLLHRIAFAALPVSIDRTLSDYYDLQYLSSTRRLGLSTTNPENKSPTTAIVYGGIEFGVNGNEIAMSSSGNRGAFEGEAYHRVFIPDNTRGKNWEPLDTTLVELRLLEQIFKSNHLFTMTLEGVKANEESFKAIGKNFPSPDILHISTHGFFFPDWRQKQDTGDAKINGGKENFEMDKNPLFRSGLILANANRAWEKGELIKDREDGILTAYEIANLNLIDTRLVVLSACNTGLGDIKGSEGVYGLQRAFKIAGVEHLIITLWSIQDSHHTVAFMETFYKKWLEEGVKIREAFTFTQQKMKEKHPDPYYWAPFVLLE